MKITNRFGFPQALVRAAENDPYSSKGDISTTRLIAPPRQVQLIKRHNADLEEDVSKRVWSLFGQGLHAVLERAAPDPALSEKRYSAEVLGWVVTGQIDVEEDGVLYDYKATKVYAYMKGPSEEWVAQGNVNRWLMSKNGRPINRLSNVLFLKDWNARDSKKKGYPAQDVATLELPLWGLDVAEQYVYERVRLHQEAAKQADDALAECTEEETWGGRRCAGWCAAASVCSQYKSKLA